MVKVALWFGDATWNSYLENSSNIGPIKEELYETKDPLSQEIFDNEEQNIDIKTVLSDKEKKPQICSNCDANFKTRKALKKHIDSVHEGKVEYKCLKCGKSFSYKHTLKIHIDSIHEGKKPNCCSTCGKAFYKKEALKEHIDKIHDKKEPAHGCEICGKMFVNGNRVARHIKVVHEKLRPFKWGMPGHHVQLGNLWLVQLGSFLWLVQLGNLWQIWEFLVLWLVQLGNF